jgi:hypothetical protein
MSGFLIKSTAMSGFLIKGTAVNGLLINDTSSSQWSNHHAEQ